MKTRKAFLAVLLVLAVMASLMVCAAADAGAYTFTCLDTDGNPVAGVRLQLCTDAQCNTMKTDENGTASLSLPENGTYTLHVIKVPAGYEYTGPAEMEITGAYHDTEIRVSKVGETAAVETQPVAETSAEVPTKLSFTTTDLDGNPVTSEELFAGYDLILVNLWEDWCSYCVEELPDIEALYEANTDRKFGVIGVVNPVENEYSSTEQVKALMEENGITYPVVRLTDDFTFIDTMGGRPLSFFVDGEGNIIPLSDPSVIAYTAEEITEMLYETLDEYLEAFKAGDLDYMKDGDEAQQESYAMLQSFVDDSAALDAYVEEGVADFMQSDDASGAYRIGDLGQISGYLSAEKWAKVVDYMFAALAAK